MPRSFNVFTSVKDPSIAYVASFRRHGNGKVKTKQYKRHYNAAILKTLASAAYRLQLAEKVTVSPFMGGGIGYTVDDLHIPSRPSD